MVSVAVAAPAVAGAKRTSMVQLEPGYSDDPAAQVPPASWKLELLVESVATARTAVPALDSVSSCVVCEPTVVGTNVELEPDRLAIGVPVGAGEAAGVAPPPPPPQAERTPKATIAAAATVTLTTFICLLLLEIIGFL